MSSMLTVQRLPISFDIETSNKMNCAQITFPRFFSHFNKLEYFAHESTSQKLVKLQSF